MAIFANNEARDTVIMEMYRNDEKKIELLRRHDKSLYGDGNNPGYCANCRDNTLAIQELKQQLSEHKTETKDTKATWIQIAGVLIALAALAVSLLK